MLDPQAAHWWIHLVAQCKKVSDSAEAFLHTYDYRCAFNVSSAQKVWKLLNTNDWIHEKKKEEPTYEAPEKAERSWQTLIWFFPPSY